MAEKNIGLTAFGICILDNDRNRRELHNINGKELTKIIYNFAHNNISNYNHDEIKETIFSYVNIQHEEVCNTEGQKIYDIAYGIVKTGEYGIESELVDADTGETSYNRTMKDADVMPFGFALLVPAGEVDSGVLLLQSAGKYGMKTVLHKNFKQIVRTENTSFRFEIGTIVPKMALDRFFNHGCLQKIRLVRYRIPNDISDRYGLNYGTEGMVEERVIRNPSGFFTNKAQEISEWRNGTRTYSQIIQIEDFEYDDLKMEFSLGNRSKTISLQNVDSVQVVEDITKEVSIVGGHPTLSSLIPIFKETGLFYLRARGLIVDGQN